MSVENIGQDDQTINIDIDGEVYTTGARTKVWSGVCAISSSENGCRINLFAVQTRANRQVTLKTALQYKRYYAYVAGCGKYRTTNS